MFDFQSSCEKCKNAKEAKMQKRPKITLKETCKKGAHICTWITDRDEPSAIRCQNEQCEGLATSFVKIPTLYKLQF